MCGNWTESSHIQSDIQMCCKGTLVCFVTLHTSSWVMWCWELPFQHLAESATWYGVTWLNLPQSDILWFGNMCRVQVTSVDKWCVLLNHAVHSFIPLAHAEFDDSLPFSGASSIPLCYVLFPAALPHQLFFHSFSPHLAICFFVYLSIMLFPNSYIILFLGILFNHAVSSNNCIMSERDKWMSNEHWSSDTDSGRAKHLGKRLSQCNFVHHKFCMEWSGIKLRPSWWEASA
jgi:hypothetical protein